MNLDGTVRDVETLVYREPRGWEVRYPFFSWTSSRGKPQTQVFATLTPSLARPFCSGDVEGGLSSQCGL